jgi:galactose mutarotase-like enzyme
MDRHIIAAGGISANISGLGAELTSLKAHGRELLWQAGPAWPRHAPVLFPIVGRLRDDRLLHNGHDYRLTQHGFARDRQFAWTETRPHSCKLTLRDDAATRALYPFAFHFQMSFEIEDNALTVTYSVANPGPETLPFSMGAHPAFRWPLADGVAKDAHRLVFEAEETAPLPGLVDGLLGPSDKPSPILHRVLHLNEGLFAHDALILPHPASRWVRFEAPGAPGIEMRWHGFPSFGIWMRPGGDFLCLEPWYGMASPADWSGEFKNKPGLALLAPGAQLEASYSVRSLEAQG